MAKLNQIIAIEADAKKHAAEGMAAATALFKKPALFSGLTKTYEPKTEEGEKLPSETADVQYRVGNVVATVAELMTRAMDLTATKDDANCNARGDVVVNGKVLLTAIPATQLLALERRLDELEKFVKTIPVLDNTLPWESQPDLNTGLFRTAPVQSVRTKKVPQVLVLYPHTDKHPAQTDKWMEDVPVGTYTKVEFSGAWPRTQVDKAINKIHQLMAAVKAAREEANGTVVTDQKVGDKVFEFVFDL